MSPLLTFQARFAPLVESGEKRQTIRAYRKDGLDPTPGQTLYHYEKARSPQMRKLGEATCLEALPLSITKSLVARLNGIVLTVRSRNNLARADGFRINKRMPYGEMIEWIKKTHGLPFQGLLIKWGSLR